MQIGESGSMGGIGVASSRLGVNESREEEGRREGGKMGGNEEMNAFRGDEGNG